MLGIRTRGRRMVDADETTELWRPPKRNFIGLIWPKPLYLVTRIAIGGYLSEAPFVVG